MRPNLQLFNDMGSEAFSAGVGQLAPYFTSIDPKVVELKPGYCEVYLQNQSKVHNHLGTIHAIAMCNAAELAGGMATDVSLSGDARWIPQGMTVRYLKKAKTDLKVICDTSKVDFSQDGPAVVHVDAINSDGEICFDANITMNIKHD